MEQKVRKPKRIPRPLPPVVSTPLRLCYSHTSGRPCKGNATITVFFRPREEVWNATRGWERPFYNEMMPNRNPALGPPEYKPISEIPVMDYYMYLQYDYWFVDYVSTAFAACCTCLCSGCSVCVCGFVAGGGGGGLQNV